MLERVHCRCANRARHSTQGIWLPCKEESSYADRASSAAVYAAGLDRDITTSIFTDGASFTGIMCMDRAYHLVEGSISCREEDSNGDREMSATVYASGLDRDIATSILLVGRAFQGSCAWTGPITELKALRCHLGRRAAMGTEKCLQQCMQQDWSPGTSP